MGRLLIIMGIVCFVVAVPYMFIMASGPENELAATVFERVLCKDNETIGQHLGSVQYDGGRSVSYYCADSEGIERDVTLGIIGVTGGGFAVMIIAGLLFTFIGVGIAVRNRMKNTMQNFQNFTVQSGQGTVFDLRDGSYQESQFSQIPPEKMEQVQQILGQVSTMFGGGQDTLSSRLQQLEDARNKGLISASEYQRVRQAILDSLDD